MLVVSNAYLEPVLRPLVPETLFFPYLQRTIDLLTLLSPVSPIFKKHKDVLDEAQRKVEAAYREFHPGKHIKRYFSNKAEMQQAVMNVLGETPTPSTGNGTGNAPGAGRGRGGSVSGSVGSQGPETPTFAGVSPYHGGPGSVHSSFGPR
jgi:hypothetical protein